MKNGRKDTSTSIPKMSVKMNSSGKFIEEDNEPKRRGGVMMKDDKL